MRLCVHLVFAGIEAVMERAFPKQKAALEHVDVGAKLKEHGLDGHVPTTVWPSSLAVSVCTLCT